MSSSKLDFCADSAPILELPIIYRRVCGIYIYIEQGLGIDKPGYAA